MIIVALIIIAVLFFLTWNLIANPRLHLLLSSLVTVLFVITICLAVANFKYHYGMQPVRHRTETRIAALMPDRRLPLIVDNQLGSDHQHQVLVYRRRSNHQIEHSQLKSSVHNRIVMSNRIKRARVVSTNTKLKNCRPASRFWFGIAQKPVDVKTENVFYLPKSWKLLSAKQMKVVKQIIINRTKQQLHSKAVQAQAKQQLNATVQKALQQHPHLNSHEKRRLISHLVRRFKAQAKQQMIVKILPSAVRTAKSNVN